jgi:AcrR family transcriptional regulator
MIVISMPKVVPEYKEEAKKKIIAAGIEVMSRRGYANTTMEDIAAHIGVSKGVLYLYFRNKDDLVAEIVKAAHAKTREMARQIFPNSSPLDAWTALFDNNLIQNPEYDSLSFEIAALATRKDIIRDSYAMNITDGIGDATHGISWQQDQGIVRKDADPRTLAIAIIAVMIGMRSLALAGIPREELRERWLGIGRILLDIDGAGEKPAPCRKKRRNS